jgi:hypothetical protein
MPSLLNALKIKIVSAFILNYFILKGSKANLLTDLTAT